MSAYMVNEDTLDLLASVAVWSNHGLFIYVKEGTLPPRGELEYAGEGESIYYRASHLKNIKEELRLENIASLWARYPNDGGTMAGEGAPFLSLPRTLRHIIIVSSSVGALRPYTGSLPSDTRFSRGMAGGRGQRRRGDEEGALRGGWNGKASAAAVMGR